MVGVVVIAIVGVVVVVVAIIVVGVPVGVVHIAIQTTISIASKSCCTDNVVVAVIVDCDSE